MTYGRRWDDGAFGIGRLGRQWTAEDLARFEERVREAKAHLDELSAAVSTPRPPRGDPRQRTLPEQLANLEKSVSEHQVKLDEARAAARAIELAIDEATRSSPEMLASLKEALSAEHGRVGEAEASVERGRSIVDRARARLPEDAEAEAQARIAWAELHLHFAERAVDSARGDLMPEACQKALKLLAEHATDEWLDRYGPPDTARRMAFRPEIVMNIAAQLQSTMFRPRLEGLDRLRNITGTWEAESEDPE